MVKFKENPNLEKYISNHETMYRNLLEKIVKTESYTEDKDGVEKVADIIHDFLVSEGVNVRKYENVDYGPHLIADIKGDIDRTIVVMGHMDTAHPDGTLAEFPWKETEDRLHGPGVSDMKSGLTTMMFATIALSKTGVENFPNIKLIFTPEEEKGSPITKKFLSQNLNDIDAVFNLEAGRPDGSIINERKGSAHLKLEIKGKASHSGAFYDEGISANDELSYKMIKIKKLMEEYEDLTINFGLIKGGVSNNIVSPEAMATLHLGFWKQEDFDNVYSDIKNIVDESYIEGTKSTIEGSIGIYPMERSESADSLISVVLETSDALNLDIEAKSTKGASDAGITSFLGIPSVCAMGPVGGKWHTHDEYMEKNSYVERTRLLAYSIMNLQKKQYFGN
ncbi:M20 family metallopeptidase [Salinicoccus sp. YB14-2]|uniref:M20 family metallopeptidase n=1 Tax=Salinicoccus sp. YB14-2 TaxID=1572701 RepID=UPI000690B758|nr:M20 family metallopeptidase [Salinicoccus sp. YB14-2]